jgi:Cu(I)/Ag(I) efflux system membrane fusion protein/cobalt-zinc-cadmium efflux system membrane fusion protein
MKSYRRAFLLAVAANVVLAAGLVSMWWYSKTKRLTPNAESPSQVIAPMAPGSAGSGMATGPTAPTEAPMVPVQLTPQRLQSIGVKTGLVEFKAVSKEIRTVGNVEVDERGLAYVQVRFAGWIQNVFANSTYQYIRKGQPLFTIYSPDLVTTENEYLLARQNRDLLAQSSVPGVAAGAASLFEAAATRLKQWEVPASEIAQLEATGKVREYLTINSPVSGYIIERNAQPNMYVQPETRLYTVADLSTVWVHAAVFQNEIGQVKPGDPATVTTDAYPGRSFAGHVDFIYPQVDMTTRTVRVRLVFPNPGLKLKPGMFMNVRMDIPLGRHVTIPTSGVFRSGKRSIVFVDRGGGYLEPREVELGPQAGEEFVVLKGLKAAERIVTSANFLIDSESQLQAAIGSFIPPPPGAGAAASMNAPEGQAEVQVEFSTVPSAPHKGSNLFRVKLTGSNRAPITGAHVTVQNFMPAMPEMGMAAMSGTTSLVEKGNGIYEGQAKLESGGTWKITVVATKDGKPLASKQLSVNAEGGT